MSGMDAPSFGGPSTDFRYKRPDTIARQSRIASRRGTSFVGMSPSIVITGITAISASLIEAATYAQRSATDITDAAGERVRLAAYDSAPVLTGVTRASLRASSEARYNGYAVSVGPEMPRSGPPVARFLIFGTVKMSRKWDFYGSAQPHIETWQAAMNRIARVL